MWEEIIAQLETIVKSIDNIQETFIYEKEQFKGTPSVTITPSSNESEFESTRDNERIYAFSVKVYVNRTVAPAGNDVDYWADKRLRIIVDELLNNLDSNYTLTGITNPPGYTFINLFATPSVWGYAGREDEFRVADIAVRARVLVDVNTIC